MPPDVARSRDPGPPLLLFTDSSSREARGGLNLATSEGTREPGWRSVPSAERGADRDVSDERSPDPEPAWFPRAPLAAVLHQRQFQFGDRREAPAVEWTRPVQA